MTKPCPECGASNADEDGMCCACGAQLSKTPDDILEEGLILRRQGRTSEALDRFNDAVTRDPTNADALYNIGAIQEEAGNIDDALKWYNKALQAQPQHVATLVAKGAIAADAGNVDSALQLFNDAIKADPHFATAYNAKGFLWQRQGVCTTKHSSATTRPKK